MMGKESIYFETPESDFPYCIFAFMYQLKVKKKFFFGQSYCVAQTGHKVKTLLPLPSKCWGHRCVVTMPR
jgi:hypothetical protein